MRRHTYEFVKGSIEKAGFKLLSTEYKNNTDLLDIMCNKGHQYQARYNKWVRGDRCPICYGRYKYNIDKVRKDFSEEGYTLLTTSYKNGRDKLEYICPKGHKHNVSGVHWYRSKSRCPYCSGLVVTIDQVRETMLLEGYTLVSDKYINNRTGLEYICPRGHSGSIAWHHWISGNRCVTCKYINLSIAFAGHRSCRWRGGVSLEPYCDAWKDKEYKKEIRERDGQICINPYCSKMHTQIIGIHHIDYDKKNCKPDNLVTLCVSCNTKANTDREWHTAWYRALLKNRYGYKY